MNNKEMDPESMWRKTTAEGRGSTLMRLQWVPHATVCECLGDLDVLSGRWLFKAFESTCINEKCWS